MKALLFLYALILPFANYCQNPILPLDNETGKIAYSDIIKFDSFAKDDIFIKANEWFVNVFNSADNVIQLNSKEDGVIIGKGFSKLTSKPSAVYVTSKLYYTIKIEVKEGRYKYSIYDIYYLAYPDVYNPSPSPLTSEFLYGIYMKEDFTKTKFKGKSKLRYTYVIDLDTEIRKIIMNLTSAIIPSTIGEEDW